MGLDIGTTGCKASVFDQNGNTLSCAYREYDVIRTNPGQAELNAEEVWDKIVQVASESAAMASVPIRALSAASMGEAMVPVDRRGRILGPSVLGTDSRGTRYLEKLTGGISPGEIYRITGQPSGGGYSLPNLCRIREEEPELYRKTFRFLPWADFVTFKLTGEMRINESLASRMLFFDRMSRRWSDQIAGTAGFDLEKFPAPIPSGVLVGKVLPSMRRALGLAPDVQVVSGAHDQCAAVLGAGVTLPGTAMLGLGTYACMVLVHEAGKEDSPFSRLRLNLEPHAIPGQEVSFLYHGSCGALLKWLRTEFFRDIRGRNPYPRIMTLLKNTGNTPVVVPYFAESGPLDFASGGNGLIAGLSLSHTRADILRGTLEGIIFYFKEALDALGENGYPVRRLHLSGGGAESAEWRQMITDILEIPTVKPEIRECGTLGAAILAGIGSKELSSFKEAVRQMVRLEDALFPGKTNRALYAVNFQRYQEWKKTGETAKHILPTGKKSDFFQTKP